ncbi:MAG: serine--tRNA ligase [Candidatus Thermoplasmatota archaeon]|nr:serine--tRNA ligase [Candidatus Thermoplasmatota archaeon]
MKFDLEATLIFSDSVEEAVKDIEEAIRESNETLLKKGVPESVEDGGADVRGFSVEKDTLTLNIDSDRYVRAHDALLRLKKRLNKELGPEHHVGVRELSIDGYAIELDLDRAPKDPEKITLPYVEEVSFDEKRCVLKISELGEKELKENYVDRIIERLKEKVDAQYYEGKEEMWELLWGSDEKEMAWEKDPTEEMLERDWIKRGPTKGKWFYRPEMAKVLKTIEKIAVKEVLKPLGFQEIVESMMVPFDVWIETGHMEGIPNEAYYVTEPKTRNPGEWEEIIDEIKIARDVPDEKLEDMIETPKAGICYAQCPTIYWSFRNETISDDSLPVLVYERTVPSARYESGGRHGLERVDEFHRIEPVYIGTKEQLLELKEKLIERYKHVFEEVLDIEWRMAKVEPFYLQQSGGSEKEEELDLGTVDFEAYLPYRGTREESEWLEFGNLSVFRKYTESFNIKSQSDTLLSGCTGIGLERWAMAFLGQKGLDRENWPEKFDDYFGDMPDGFELL